MYRLHLLWHGVVENIHVSWYTAPMPMEVDAIHTSSRQSRLKQEGQQGTLARCDCDGGKKVVVYVHDSLYSAELR